MLVKGKGIFFRFWFPLIVYSGIIFWMSSIPSIDVPSRIPFWDKMLHFLEYMPFGFLTVRALVNSQTSLSSHVLLWSVVITMFYGLSDEFHQSFVIGRDASVYDVIVDTLGGWVGSIVYLKWSWKRE